MATMQERAELHKTIWKIANDLRGSIDGWEFKAYVLGSIFYGTQRVCPAVSSQKFKAFVTNHPAVMGDPLYPEIQKNIKANLLLLSITIHDEWGGETTIEY